ncbi:potassium transporter TrkA [Fulvitalea axinellae]|uniref:Potassium transporter TrkA n=1 Tax=Fulvitalea axinellae TaxID=1182444 RepID=A0AAU9CQ68_9BACT|nr:potassium transporter TrkA [Fulvitalea axinellae]
MINATRVHHYSKRLRRFYLACGCIVASIGTGTTFYIYHEGFTPANAVYMAIITLSTVGFGEVEPLSEVGRIFTSGYIVVNLVIIAFGISTMAGYIFEGELRTIFRSIMTGNEVNKLKGHIIVCGYGRNGMKTCEEFRMAGKRFVVIENDPDICHALTEDPRFNVITGDATVEDTLRMARIDSATALITTLPKDSDNVYISLTSRELNRDLMIIARANEESAERKLKLAGANRVVKPDALGGSHMAKLVTQPVVIEFLDLLNGLSTETDMRLEEFAYGLFKKEYMGKTLRELDIRRNTNVMVIGYKHPEKGFLFTPSTSLKLNQNSVLILMGDEESLKKFKSRFSI